MDIFQYKVLDDNYNYLLHDQVSGLTAVVDPSEYKSTMLALKENNWNLDYIFNTHHHYDHIGGNNELRKHFECQIYGPNDRLNRIPNTTRRFEDKDEFKFGETQIKVLSLPGHTESHIAYWIPKHSAVFCGDVVFALGCGKIFEGTPETMYESVMKVAELPKDTKIYCAHEYTLNNARFALTLEPGNRQLQSRFEEVERLREKGIPTVPSLIGDEIDTNPFLRSSSKEIREKLNMEMAKDWEVFAEMRRRKDNY